MKRVFEAALKERARLQEVEPGILGGMSTGVQLEG